MNVEVQLQIIKYEFVQVLCWGVRDMKRYQLLSVTSPLVEVECGGTVVRTQPIKDASKDPNFPDPIISFDVVSKLNPSIAPTVIPHCCVVFA